MNNQTNSQSTGTFVVLTYAFTWLILLPAVLASAGLFTLPVPTLVPVAIAQFGPSLAAFLLVFRRDGKHGAAALFKRALSFHIPLRWLLMVFLVPLALAVAALYLNVWTGGSPPTLALLAQPIAIVPMFFFILFLQGPVPEEFGWRGYMLDRVQAKHTALAASVIVGLVWGVWHLPLFVMGYLPFPFWAYVISVVALSILFTWIYNNTNNNLLTALLFHTMFNLSIQLFPPMELNGGDARGFYILTALYVLVAAVVVLVWGAHTLRRGHRQATATA